MTDYIKRTTTLEALKERGEQLFERTKGTEHIPLIIAFQQAMNILLQSPHTLRKIPIGICLFM